MILGSRRFPGEGIGYPSQYSWAFLVADGKESACNAEDLGLTPVSGRSLGEGNGNPLQYSCPENPMDRGVLRASVHGVPKSRTRLSVFTFIGTVCGFVFKAPQQILPCSKVISKDSFLFQIQTLYTWKPRVLVFPPPGELPHLPTHPQAPTYPPTHEQSAPTECAGCLGATPQDNFQ